MNYLPNNYLKYFSTNKLTLPFKHKCSKTQTIAGIHDYKEYNITELQNELEHFQLVIHTHTPTHTNTQKERQRERKRETGINRYI